MDPMTLLALLQAGGSFLQGSFAAAGAQQENNMNNAMARRKALRLGDVARMLEGMDSMARLPQAYSRALSGSVGASRASASMRGLGDSGMQAELESRMQGDALAQLASQVNQSEQQRAQLLAGIYSDPAFGALDQSEMPDMSGLIALQGLLGGGMALAPLFMGAGAAPPAGPTTATNRSSVAPIASNDVGDIMGLANFASQGRRQPQAQPSAYVPSYYNPFQPYPVR